MNAVKAYLTHSDSDSILAGKHQYSDEEIIDVGLLSTVEKKDSHDFTYTIMLQLERGVPLRSLLRIYGKDFLYHYRQYKEFLEDMKEQERRIELYSGLKPTVKTDVKPHWFDVDFEQNELPL